MWSRQRSVSTKKFRDRHARWFRIDPAACRVVLQGALTADRILLNARALGVYGASPIRRTAATRCASRRIISSSPPLASAAVDRRPQPSRKSRRQRPTTAIWSPNLAEDSEYDDEQARLAGIQRLLVIAGYDAAPIDGVDGPKTQSALAAFLKSRGLAADVVQSQNFFTTMIEGRAEAVVQRVDVVQRHAAQDHGGGRHRRR